jgi:hypothetical protein
MKESYISKRKKIKKSLSVFMMALFLALTLAACGDDGESGKSGADLLTGQKNGSTSVAEEKLGGKGAQSYQIKFGKYFKQPTFDYYFQEVELLTECLKGINAEIRPGQEFSYTSSASVEGWSMSLKMTGQLGETTYRDGMIPALKGQMEFSASHSDGRSSMKFSGPFVLPFATLRPLDPDYETLRIGYEDVVGEKKARITYYYDNILDKEYDPPEAFWFTVEPSK